MTKLGFGFFLLIIFSNCSTTTSKLPTLTLPHLQIDPYTLNENPHKPVLILDAGHGGRDPGAVNDSLKLYEKNVTLKIVNEIAKIIDTSKITLILTRKKDTNYNRHDRITFANQYNPDLLLTIHINEQKDTTASGYELSYSDTLLKTVQPNGDSIKVPNPYKALLKKHSQIINKNIANSFPKMRQRDIKVRKDDIWMIYAGHYPSLLVEFGFITNRVDVTYLKNEESLQNLAKALCKSIYTILKV